MVIKSYEGNEPYIFISYAHKDSELVMPILSALQGKGFRVWYDAGIEAGTEWPEYIAEHLNGAARVLTFLSRNFVESQNCRREINFAIDLKKEPLVVHLEDFELSLGMRMQLGTLQGIMYYRHNSFESFVEALTKVKELAVCREVSGDNTDEEIATTLEHMLSSRMFENVRAYAAALFEKGYEKAFVYRALLLSEFGVKDEAELVTVQSPIDASANYRRLLELGDEWTQKRYRDYADTVNARLAKKSDQAAEYNQKKMALLERRVQTAAKLNEKHNEEKSLSHEIAQKQALFSKNGDPKRIVKSSRNVLIVAILNFIFFLSFVLGDRSSWIVLWLLTGVIYYVFSAAQIKDMKKSGFLWILNLFTFGCFGWIYAIVGLVSVKRQRAIGNELYALNTRLEKVRKEKQGFKEGLKLLNEEIDTME